MGVMHYKATVRDQITPRDYSAAFTSLSKAKAWCYQYICRNARDLPRKQFISAFVIGPKRTWILPLV